MAQPFFDDQKPRFELTKYTDYTKLGGTRAVVSQTSRAIRSGPHYSKIQKKFGNQEAGNPHGLRFPSWIPGFQIPCKLRCNAGLVWTVTKAWDATARVPPDFV